MSKLDDDIYSLLLLCKKVNKNSGSLITACRILLFVVAGLLAVIGFLL